MLVVMPPPSDKDEAQTRQEIDRNLFAAGWMVQDDLRMIRHESLGVAVREMDATSRHERNDRRERNERWVAGVDSD